MENKVDLGNTEVPVRQSGTTLHVHVVVVLRRKTFPVAWRVSPTGKSISRTRCMTSSGDSGNWDKGGVGKGTRRPRQICGRGGTKWTHPCLDSTVDQHQAVVPLLELSVVVRSVPTETRLRETVVNLVCDLGFSVPGSLCTVRGWGRGIGWKCEVISIVF